VTNPGEVLRPSNGERHHAFKEMPKIFSVCDCYLLFCLGAREMGVVRVKTSKGCNDHHSTASPGAGPFLTSVCVWEQHSSQ